MWAVGIIMVLCGGLVVGCGATHGRYPDVAAAPSLAREADAG